MEAVTYSPIAYHSQPIIAYNLGYRLGSVVCLFYCLFYCLLYCAVGLLLL
jgi:hypothetical protein